MPSQQYFRHEETVPPNLWDFYPPGTHNELIFYLKLLAALSRRRQAAFQFRLLQWAEAVISEYAIISVCG